jgi:predicted transcriptional regulator
LARKVADGYPFFRHDLWPGGLILTKPSQDAGEHQTELIRLERPQFSYGSDGGYVDTPCATKAPAFKNGTLTDFLRHPSDAFCRHIPPRSVPPFPALRRGCTKRRFPVSLEAMEVHFTREQEAQLAQMATKAGTKPERLATDVLVRYLNDEARFLAAVERGIAAAGRGELFEEEEMDARIERMFEKP